MTETGPLSSGCVSPSDPYHVTGTSSASSCPLDLL
jgi:hypothetical protein